MTPHEIEAMTPAELSVEAGLGPYPTIGEYRWLINVRDAVVEAIADSPTDALEVPERVAHDIAMSDGNRYREAAERLALILLRAYTPEEPS